MAVTNLYFSSSAGYWNNLTIGQGPLSLYGTAGTSLKATLHVPENVKSMSLGVNVSVKPTLTGPLTVTLQNINVIGPSGASYNVYTVFYGGCSFPLNQIAPASYNNTGSLASFNNEVANWAGQDIELEINSCITPSPITGNDIAWTLTAYMAVTLTTEAATVMFTVVGGGTEISGLPVQINNTTENTSTTLITNSNGQITYTGGSVGDDLHVIASMSHANTVSETVTIEQTSENFNVTMMCTTGYGFSGGTCQLLGGLGISISSAGKYILVAAGVIGGVAVAYEVTKGHAVAREIEAARLPLKPAEE